MSETPTSSLEAYAEYQEAILRTLGKEPSPEMKKAWVWLKEAHAFPRTNRERRPYQRLLLQNRFELDLYNKLGIKTGVYLRTLRRFLKLATLIELPLAVRMWVALFVIARSKSAFKKGYKKRLMNGRLKT